MRNEKIKPGLPVRAQGREMKKSGTGVHVGTVDHLDGENYIKLTRNDSWDGKHHWIPTAWVESVDDRGVFLNKSEDEVRRSALSDNPVQKAS